jgi:hypothetical protein
VAPFQPSNWTILASIVLFITTLQGSSRNAVSSSTSIVACLSVAAGMRRFYTLKYVYTMVLTSIEWYDFYGNRDSSVDIVTGYGLGCRGIGVRVPVGIRFVSSPRRPAFYPMGTGSSFSGGKAAVLWSCPLTSI